LVLVASLALAVALLFAALAVFAAEARAGSLDSEPPKAVLMKYKTVLQTAYAASGTWHYYKPLANGYPGGFGYTIYDNFGFFSFSKPDEVGAGRRLHARFDKPERPNFVEVNAWPRAKKAKGCGGCKRFSGQKRQLEHTLRPVKQDGKTVGWDIFFRVNKPGRHYYLRVTSGWKRDLRVSSGWKQVPGKHASYGRMAYALHVKTR